MARYFILFWMWYQYFSNKEVKSVFYFDLKPARKIFADFRTFASYLAVELKDFSVLLLRPFFLFDSGMKLINESLSYFLSVFWAQDLLKQLPVFSYFLINLNMVSSSKDDRFLRNLSYYDNLLYLCKHWF